MAKLAPVPTLREMESSLGYSLSESTINLPLGHYYSDLRPVSTDLKDRTQRELAEANRMECDGISHSLKFGVGLVNEHIASEDMQIHISEQEQLRLFRFSVTVKIRGTVALSLLLSVAEAEDLLSVSKMRETSRYPLQQQFGSLPRELRDAIFRHALSPVEIVIDQDDANTRLQFPRTMGDPCGFFYSIRPLGCLAVSKSLRMEMLPILYQHTICQTDDLDDAVKLLLAIGTIGRQNLSTLEITWESRTDLEERWNRPEADQSSPALPRMHVSTLVRLLDLCTSLKLLRIKFAAEDLIGISFEDFKIDPGIVDLTSISGFEQVHVIDMMGEPITGIPHVRWLQAQTQL